MKKFKFTLMLVLLVTGLNFNLFSQSNSNGIYLELLGNGGLYSINYDRLFSENLGGRIGFMYLSEFNFIFSSAENLLFIPIMLNYLSGGDHNFEIGGGIVIVHADKVGFFGISKEGSSTAVGGTATIGYRYQPSRGGFLFRIGFTPFYADGDFAASGGFSIGFCF